MAPRSDSVVQAGAGSLSAANHLGCEQRGGVPVLSVYNNPVMVVLGSGNPGFHDTPLQQVVRRNRGIEAEGHHAVRQVIAYALVMIS
jgi:hypothetical protein